MAKPTASRREFFEAASLAAGGSLVAGSAGTAVDKGTPGVSTLPTVSLGPHRVTRLVLGGNPIYGHSHFNRLYSQHLVNYHTPQRVVELLQTCASNGINTWQNSYSARTIEDVLKCREAGILFHWLLLGKPDWVERPGQIEEAAAHKPIGIAPHGSSAERLHREGRVDQLADMLKRIRQTGALVGLSAHNPETIALADERGWDVDYYMCCLYYLTRPKRELEKMLGQAPIGEVYLPSDRERMLKVVAAASKPCLVYKVLAAGRLDLTPTAIRRTFDETLRAIKPTDAMIVGMFQEFGDQVSINCRIVREHLA